MQREPRWTIGCVYRTFDGLCLFRFDDLIDGQVSSEVSRRVLCVFGAGVMGLVALARVSVAEAG